jgi:transcriptional regulator with XRE-family HTH domain
LGISQSELGQRVGISRVAVCEYESGRARLSDRTVERMLDVLDIDTQKRAQRRLTAAVRTITSEIERQRAS